MAAMFANRSGRNEQSLQRTLRRFFLPSLISFGQTVSEEQLFYKSTNQKQELPVTAMLIEDLPQILPTKFRFIWPTCLKGEDFGKSTNQKQEFTVVAMFVSESEQNGQSLQRTAHRCFLPSFGSFGQAASEKILKNRPIRNKNRLWWPCLLTDRD